MNNWYKFSDDVMRLKDVAKISVNMPEADFWIIRRGSIENVGKPVDDFHEERIGVKIENTEMLFPQYAKYMMMYIWMSGYYRSFATGTTELVNIKVSDVKDIRLKIK